MSKIEVLTGPERRRRWSEDQKRAIVAAAFALGAVVSAVARQADLNACQIYRWRTELRGAPSTFSELVVSSGFPQPADPVPAAIDVELSDGSRVRIPASIPPTLAASVLTALVRR